MQHKLFCRCLSIASLVPGLLLAGCGAHEKEAAAKEIARCRTQIKDIPDPALRDQKDRSCAKMEFDFKNKYNTQPEPK